MHNIQFAGVKMMQRLRSWDNRIGTFLPVSTFMICWYFIVISALIADYFLTIYFICFHSFKNQFEDKKVTLPLLLLILSVDILMSLNTSFIENGRIVTEKSEIRKQYLRSMYFLVDCIVVIVTTIQLITVESTFLNFVVYPKILKISNFDNLIRKYVIKSSNLKLTYHICKHLIMLVMVCHFIGCFFFYLDIQLIRLEWYSLQNLWVYSSYAYADIISLPAVWQYCYSFYYAVVTLSGVAYGDLTPLNPTEVAYTLLSLLIPLTLYAYILSVVHGEISERRTKALQEIKFRMIAKKYFEQSGIDNSSIPRFINYLLYSIQRKDDSDNAFLDSTAPSIKEDYIRSVVSNNFDFSIFHPLLREQIRINQIEKAVYSIAQEQPYPARQSITQQKSKVIKLYFVASGQISEIILIKQRKYNKIINAKEFFNQYSFFTGLFQSANHLFQTCTFTICHTISADKFIETLWKTPIFQSFHQYRNKIIFSNQLNEIRVRCLFCEQNTHFIGKCPRLRLAVDLDKLRRSKNQRRKQFKRKNIINKKQFNFLKPIEIFSGFLNLLESKQINKSKGSQAQEKRYHKCTAILDVKRIDVVKNWMYFEKEYTL